MLLRTLFFTIALSFASCSGNSDKINSQNRFFDLKAYFLEEAQALEGQQISVSKVVKLNGESEDKVVSNVDWQKEFKLFSDSNINRSSWLDKYSVDSVSNAGQLKELHYKALSEQLKTRSIDIYFTGSKVSKVFIVKKTDNQIFTSNQKLTYIPRKEYRIIADQDAPMSDKQSFEVYGKLTSN